MITLILCEVTMASMGNPTPRPGYQLFRPIDAPNAGRIATITGSVVSKPGRERVQRSHDEPMRGDVLCFYDDLIEVHSVDWICVP